MSQKQFLIIGNWKMNPKSAREARSLFAGLTKKSSSFGLFSQVVVAPPFPYLSYVRSTKKIQLAAQDVHWEREGAYTGEVSLAMLKDAGVQWVIVGHSERRRMFFESDEIVNKKLRATIKAGLTPVVCIGEAERDLDGAFFATLRRQIEVSCAGLSKNDLGKMIIAYEPIWAVGAEKPARPEDANEAALFIKKVMAQRYGVSAARKLRVLYGGSVNKKNAGAFLREQEIDGLLVGRESLHAQDFIGIIQCADLRL